MRWTPHLAYWGVHVQLRSHEAGGHGSGEQHTGDDPDWVPCKSSKITWKTGFFSSSHVVHVLVSPGAGNVATKTRG